MKLGDKLKEIRKQNNLTQTDLAKILNITKPTYANFENDSKSMTLEMLQQLASHFSIPIENLLFDSIHTFKTSDKTKKIPILSSVSAGVGIFGEEIPVDWLELPEAIAKKADYASFVSGDSMEPKITSGDLLLIEKTDVLENGDIGVFKIGEDIVCKKFKSNPIIREITLISLNPKYKSILIDNDYCKNNEFNILGKVVGKLDYDF
ncbi:helix-turn-helix domain-containing protein [Cetobacterium somerae]|uniref:LexA family protein n=1 Tax=Cetobacterium somerae TaxID=188913 RepID=UPI00216C7FD7|nr:helix-turn-helix domain-containing protein [Cetobacterium somerae]